MVAMRGDLSLRLHVLLAAARGICLGGLGVATVGLSVLLAAARGICLDGLGMMLAVATVGLSIRLGGLSVLLAAARDGLSICLRSLGVTLAVATVGLSVRLGGLSVLSGVAVVRLSICLVGEDLIIGVQQSPKLCRELVIRFLVGVGLTNSGGQAGLFFYCSKKTKLKGPPKKCADAARAVGCSLGDWLVGGCSVESKKTSILLVVNLES